MKKQVKLWLSLLLNLTIVAFEVVAFYQGRKMGVEQFQFYTQLSNLLAGVVCLIFTGFLLRLIRSGVKIPSWCSFLKYTVSIMLAQTFLISLTFLSIASGSVAFLMLGPIVRYFHTLCPILSVVSFLLLDPKMEPFTRQHTMLAMIPTLLYGTVAIILNIMRVWHGPYPFLYVYEQPLWLSAVWFVTIFGAAFLIAFLLRIASCRLHREYVY